MDGEELHSAERCVPLGRAGVIRLLMACPRENFPDDVSGDLRGIFLLRRSVHEDD